MTFPRNLLGSSFCICKEQLQKWKRKVAKNHGKQCDLGYTMIQNGGIQSIENSIQRLVSKLPFGADSYPFPSSRCIPAQCTQLIINSILPKSIGRSCNFLWKIFGTLYATMVVLFLFQNVRLKISVRKIFPELTCGENVIVNGWRQRIHICVIMHLILHETLRRNDAT